MSENKSGIYPVKYKCLILPEVVEEKQGALYLPPTAREKEQQAQFRGTLVDVGGNAFEEWTGRIPRVGDLIQFVRHTGVRNVKGKDDRLYWIIQDEDILAVIET